MPLSAIEEQRKEALELYESAPVPTWRRSGFWTTSIRNLELDSLETKSYQPVTSRDDLPAVVTEALGDDELGGLIVQRGGTVIYRELSDQLHDQGVVLCTLEEAFENHYELAQQYYGKRLKASEGKFVAANAALWTGGAFVYVPRDLSIDKPIQVVYLIDEPGTAQYARTLAIVDEGSKAYFREFYLAPDFDGQALHAGGLELFARPSSNVKLATFQDWGHGEIYDISTRRVEIARDAICHWHPVHLGGHLTKQTLDIITAERGSGMRHNGIYFIEADEHFDLFTTDRHEIGDTTGDTVWKGAVTGRARASYEGLIEIIEGAQNSHTYLQTHSMMLSKQAKVDAIPSLIVKTDDVSASHGGTVGEIDEEQIFYMRSRGIPRLGAVRILIEGFFEPVVALFEDEHLAGMVRERINAKLARAESDVMAYARAK